MVSMRVSPKTVPTLVFAMGLGLSAKVATKESIALHTAFDLSIRPYTDDDDPGPADAVDSALPLADETSRLLGQARTALQQQGKDSDHPLRQHIHPPIARHTRTADWHSRCAA